MENKAVQYISNMYQYLNKTVFSKESLFVMSKNSTVFRNVFVHMETHIHTQKKSFTQTLTMDWLWRCNAATKTHQKLKTEH